MIYVALQVLLTDLCHMVCDGIQADSAQQHAEDPDKYTKQWMEHRSRLLNAWAGAEHPWSFGGGEYKALVKVLTGNLQGSNEPMVGLPGLGMTAQVTGAEVGKVIVSQVERFAKVRASAPLVRSGHFQRILPTLFEVVAIRAPKPGSPVDQDPLKTTQIWIAELFEEVLIAANVEFLPWKPLGNSSNCGFAVFNSYINCRARSTDRQRLIVNQASSSSSSSLSYQPTSEPVSNPLWGDWTVASSNLQTLFNYLHHEKLPSDIYFPQPEQQIWEELREWITHHGYSPRNFHDHLALICALFMNRLAPYYQFHAKKRSLVLEPGQSLFNAMRNVPWYAAPGKSNRSPGGSTFGVWFLWILAFIEPSSPLRARLLKGNPLGDDLMNHLSM